MTPLLETQQDWEKQNPELLAAWQNTEACRQVREIFKEAKSEAEEDDDDDGWEDPQEND